MVEEQSSPQSAPTEHSTPEQTPSEQAPSEKEIAEVVAELEKYRERLVEDIVTTAKKAKLPKSMVMEQIENHPEILKIDASLSQLRGEASD
ncbi:MAG: hypothetical protein AAFQ74_06250 [Cyanobacteria bacterium J06623_4]